MTRQENQAAWVTGKRGGSMFEASLQASSPVGACIWGASGERSELQEDWDGVGRRIACNDY